MGEDNRGRRYISAVSEASYGDARMAHDEHVGIGEPAAARLSCTTQACAGRALRRPHPRIARRVATRLA